MVTDELVWRACVVVTPIRVAVLATKGVAMGIGFWRRIIRIHGRKNEPRVQLKYSPGFSPVVIYGSKLAIDLTVGSMAPTWDTPSVSEVGEERFRAFQSALKPGRRSGFVKPLLVATYITHFDGLVSAYFNRDLARAMATAEWAMEHRPEAPASIYLVEDAVLRHCACWDYAFQMLVHFLGMQDDVLPQHQDRKLLLHMVSFNLDFIEEGGVTHIRSTPKSRDEALRAFRTARKRTEVIEKGARGDRFFKRVNRTFAHSEWLTVVRAHLRSQPVRRVHELRNQIAHAHPMSAQTFPEFAEVGIPGPSLSLTPLKPDDIIKEFEVLRDAHRELEAALRTIRTAMLNYAIPNVKANAGVTYQVHTLICNACSVQTFMPQSPSGTDFLICRACGSEDSETVVCTATTTVPEPVWADMVRETRQDLLKFRSSSAG